MFWTRLISSIVLLLIAVPSLLIGGAVLWTVLAAVSFVGVFELYRVRKIERTALGFAGYIGVLAWWVLAVGVSFSRLATLALPVLAGTLLLELAVFVFAYPKYQAEQLFTSLFALFYVAVMLSFLYLVREHIRLGSWLVWLVFIASWGSDTCAYAVGMLLGRHKLAPVLSPKKSIEGSIGGIAGAALLGALFGVVMCRTLGEPRQLIGIFALIGGVGSVISQIGDLAASGIKRCYEVKDYGTLIPGHGGILDRFDSVIVTAPIVYYLALFLLEG